MTVLSKIARQSNFSKGPFSLNSCRVVSVATKATLASPSVSSTPTTDGSAYLRHGDMGHFLQLIRKPPEFFHQVVEGTKHRLHEIDSIQDKDGVQASRRAQIHELLTAEERRVYLKTMYTNMCFSRPVSTNFGKSALALPTMGATVYSHTYAGLVNYVLEKRKSLGMKDEEHFDMKFKLDKEELKYKAPVFYRMPICFANYYRTPILVEELERFGLRDHEYYDAIAKAFFLQYHSGNFETDEQIFNPLIRVFYPQGKHIVTGANDLGRETEFQAAKLFSHSYEGMENPPLTIVNYGDSGPFTDGHMHAMIHCQEANERGTNL